MNNIKFDKVFNHKVIYAFEVQDEKHSGLIKIGDATLHTSSSVDVLSPNSRELNQAALKRIKSYTNTVGIKPVLLYTELATKEVELDDGSIRLRAFRDYEVHRVLENSNIHSVELEGTTGREWFRIDKETAIEAIQAVKKGYKNLSNTKISDISKIILRPEQKEAIAKTVNQFKKHDRMLWNAKMRFGKTLSALQVIRECKFNKTIILTHRPVVNEGWYEDFSKIFYGTKYLYGSKTHGYSVKELIDKKSDFIYFASLQDLRGSEAAGGKFNKNDDIFETVWDCVIIDEAHEGTKTNLGSDTIKAILKEDLHKTKLLSLSGTPFNILDEYDDESIYTWDYLMEQECKTEWDKLHFGDSNPYDELPELRIYTYDLGDILHNNNYSTYEEKAFNFSEFFKTWTGDFKLDNAQMPENANIGDFVHEKDVESFLNLMTKQDDKNCYPYSNKEYCELFKHSLWMVPGVREAKALKKLMEKHKVFGCGQFNIVNVAGNDDEEAVDALNSVKKAIKKAEKLGTYTITLSCGKLTTGVTVKEWTAVFMLSGSFSTSAANYLQTIFRVQSPCNKDGKIKDVAYVFDFAPDRTLKMVSEAVAISAKAGKTTDGDKAILGKFLNFCPVISISGSQMREYKVDRLLQELKKAYADKVVQNGFDDKHLYNDELLKLSDIDIQRFDKLKGIIGTTNATTKPKDITINDQGLTNEEYERQEQINKKPKKERTEEEIAFLQELKKKNKLRNDAISILRGVSIRMPLLIYGADVPYDEEITLDMFVNQVDDSSWNEFMPKGVTKEIFNDFRKYYDEDVFVASGRRIRNIAREADTLNPTERVSKIATLFSNFKNPDKETVLTPWRVVNLHMSGTLGGFDFFDETHEIMLDKPRFVDQGKVTKDSFSNTSCQILEINSKTGLYPLYIAYSIYREKLKQFSSAALSIETKRKLWNETIVNNVFVICKTPMAKQITQRTLAGYSNVKINAHYFDDLINQLEHKPQQFIDRVLKSSYWKKGKIGKMKFDAVVGNPPYQEEITQKLSATNGQAPRKSIFQYFQIASDEISSGVVSLIYPGARWIHRSGKGMAKFGYEQINDKTLEKVIFYPNSQDIFKEVAIADGISIVYKNKNKKENGFTYVYRKNGSETEIYLNNPGEELIPLNPNDGLIISKANDFVSKYNLTWLHERILPRNLFGIESNFVEEHPDQVKIYNELSKLKDNEIKLFTNDKAGKAGRSKWFIVDKSTIKTNLDKVYDWQVVVSSANAGGQKRDNQIEIIDNISAFGRSRVALGSFKTKQEADNFYKYTTTYLIKFLFLMTDEALTSLGKKVPDLIDYTNNNSIIDFERNLDEQLYKLLGLSDNESHYIEDTIKNLR
ncbi:Eco57I restriction-modification methylase domain-containing protein [Succinatimonas hippei]|uniref:Eco57I restriction-modification methylase domain-containing protein n=1 Tax=Succinatimonas hippei TaxID=626938 RepID=UPI00248F9BA3|nr:Eco57I restriction-modification methylase domain-containing protein [Succinatimonas hippei]